MACYLSGSACAIHHRALERASVYDDALFCSGEEPDLPYRLLEAGLGILFDPTVVIRYHQLRGYASALATHGNTRNRPRSLPPRYALTHCGHSGRGPQAAACGYRHLRYLALRAAGLALSESSSTVIVFSSAVIFTSGKAFTT